MVAKSTGRRLTRIPQHGTFK